MKRSIASHLTPLLSVLVLLAITTSPPRAQVSDADVDVDAEAKEDDYTPTASAVPSTDIFVGQLSLGERPAVTAVFNATDREGYDNQPFFLPDQAAILYTSARDDEQTDIYRFVLASKKVEQVTETPTSEYSPTVLPDGQAFATIREARGVQQLWKYGFDGSDRGGLFEEVQPVGYQAWADEHSIAVFVLGDEETPHTLRLIDGRTGKATTIAPNPGRSLHKIPGRRAISFVHKLAEEDDWWIKTLDPETGEIEKVVETLPGEEDYAWTPAGTILMGAGSVLYEWQPGGEWKPIADLGEFGVDGITRIAVSPNGDRIAFVATRPATE